VTARATYHHGDLARAVREATVAVLAEQGAEALSLREVARRVGVNHRALYRHFEDKRALLAAVAEDGYRDLAAAMRAAVEARGTEDAVDRLVALGEGYLRYARQERARYEVMFGPRLNEDERFPTLEAAITDAVRVVGAELKRAAPEASSVARRDAGIALWSAVHGLSSLVLVGRVRLKDAHVARYCDTLLRPIAAGLCASLRA
jgi:AcrR family transcriptional regulator